MVTKQEVLDTIKQHMLEIVPDLSDADFDPAKSMADLGANSLDIVDVVSSTLRDLRIKIPRTELVDIENIDGFASLVVAAADLKS